MASIEEITVFWQIGPDIFSGRVAKINKGYLCKIPGTERCLKTFASVEEAKNNFDKVKEAEANSISF